MAAWGDEDEDINISARLIAAELVELFISGVLKHSIRITGKIAKIAAAKVAGHSNGQKKLHETLERQETSQDPKSTDSLKSKSIQPESRLVKNRNTDEPSKSKSNTQTENKGVTSSKNRGLPPYPKWSAKFIHDYFAMKVLGRKAREKVFPTPWSADRGLGTGRFDDWVESTHYAMEFNTTPWSTMTPSKLSEKISKKLEQVGSDFALLKRNPQVKKIIWVNSEPLPVSGPAKNLAKALNEAGIEYWHVPLPNN